MPELRIVIAIAAATSLVVSIGATLLFRGAYTEEPAEASAPERKQGPTTDGSELAALREVGNIPVRFASKATAAAAIITNGTDVS